MTIAQCHDKQKSVLKDHKDSMRGLRLNYMKWFNEYNTILHKLKLRDQLKDKRDKSVQKTQEIQNERYKASKGPDGQAMFEQKLAR